jgi:hypothetical protein
MYREEVDQLVAMFQRGCEKVTISDSKYRYDSLEEMKQKVGPRIKHFDIRGENPGVRFLFNQTEIVRISNPPLQTTYNELRTEQITDAADGVFYTIKDFLVTHQRPAFLREWIVPTILSLICMFWFVIHNSEVNKEGQAVIRSLPGLLISVVVFAGCVAMGLNSQNFVSLETKRNSASFFVRNWEEFAKHAVTAGISGVIGYCIGYFLK